MLFNFVADQVSSGDLKQIELNNGYRYWEWFGIEEYWEAKIAIYFEMIRFQFSQYLCAGKTRARSGANAKARLMRPSLLQ